MTILFNPQWIISKSKIKKNFRKTNQLVIKNWIELFIVKFQVNVQYVKAK